MDHRYRQAHRRLQLRRPREGVSAARGLEHVSWFEWKAEWEEEGGQVWVMGEYCLGSFLRMQIDFMMDSRLVARYRLEKLRYFHLPSGDSASLAPEHRFGAYSGLALNALLGCCAGLNVCPTWDIGISQWRPTPL